MQPLLLYTKQNNKIQTLEQKHNVHVGNILQKSPTHTLKYARNKQSIAQKHRANPPCINWHPHIPHNLYICFASVNIATDTHIGSPQQIWVSIVEHCWTLITNTNISNYNKPHPINQSPLSHCKHRTDHTHEMTPGELGRTERVRQSPPDVISENTWWINTCIKWTQIPHITRRHCLSSAWTPHLCYTRI